LTYRSEGYSNGLCDIFLCFPLSQDLASRSIKLHPKANCEQASATNKSDLYAQVRTLASIPCRVLILSKIVATVASDTSTFGRIVEFLREAPSHVRRIRDASNVAAGVEDGDPGTVCASSRAARDQSMCGVWTGSQRADLLVRPWRLKRLNYLAVASVDCWGIWVWIVAFGRFDEVPQKTVLVFLVGIFCLSVLQCARNVRADLCIELMQFSNLTATTRSQNCWVVVARRHSAAAIGEVGRVGVLPFHGCSAPQPKGVWACGRRPSSYVGGHRGVGRHVVPRENGRRNDEERVSPRKQSLSECATEDYVTSPMAKLPMLVNYAR
jgi:hypothetical protein